MLLFISSILAAQSQRAGRYEVTLRLPEEGLFASEEMQIEYRVTDTSKDDPVMGAAPVIRAKTRSVVDMPSMPGMPTVEELAHPEGIPGEYGIHPLFAHGGTFRLRIWVTPPNGDEFQVEFPLEVKDARPAGQRVSLYKLELGGKPEDLTLKIIGPQGVVKDFDIVHEKEFHLIAIRKDLAVFQHVHPEPSPDGTFRLKHKWPAGGDYVLFADVAPRGKGSRVLSAPLKIKGNPNAPPLNSPLKLEFGALPKPGRSAVVAVKYAPDLPLEPYLGAMGHLLVVHEDTQTLVHSHPLDEMSRAGEIDFMMRLPKPGKYRAWLELKSRGKVIATQADLEAK